MNIVETQLKILKMKKTGILFFVFVMIITTTIAQQRGGQRNLNPEDIAKRQTERMDEALDLTKDQEKNVYEINLESGKKMRDLREKMRGGGFEGMREKMGEIREEQNEKMKKVLSASQWKKYEKYLEERQERMREGRSRNRQ